MTQFCSLRCALAASCFSVLFGEADRDRAYLQKEYCPPIDTALFSAIISDYDLSDPLGIDEVRPVLDTLKDSAEAEGTTHFDPSGSSGLNYTTSTHESPDRARSWHGEDASRSEETDSTSLPQSIEMLGIEPFSGLDTEGYEVKHEKPGARAHRPTARGAGR